jgi:hypothetical protein
MVFRTFPIRVSGEQAGPMKDEITWEALRQESGYPHPVQEMTTVSKKLRRVGRFDWDLAARAVRVNRPTRIALNGLDYLAYEDSPTTTQRLMIAPPSESSRAQLPLLSRAPPECYRFPELQMLYSAERLSVVPLGVNPHDRSY